MEVEQQSSQETEKTDDSLQRHRDSASTLGFTSSASNGPPPPAPVLELHSSHISERKGTPPLATATTTSTVVEVSSPTEEAVWKLTGGEGVRTIKVKSLEVSWVAGWLSV